MTHLRISLFLLKKSVRNQSKIILRLQNYLNKKDAWGSFGAWRASTNVHGVEVLAVLEDGPPGTVLVGLGLPLLLLLLVLQHALTLGLGAPHGVEPGLLGGWVPRLVAADGVATGLVFLDHLDFLGRLACA